MTDVITLEHYVKVEAAIGTIARLVDCEHGKITNNPVELFKSNDKTSVSYKVYWGSDSKLVPVPPKFGSSYHAARVYEIYSCNEPIESGKFEEIRKALSGLQPIY